MRLLLAISALFLLSVGGACALLSGSYACEDDTNCPDELVCSDGNCVAGEGEGEGEGEGDPCPTIAGPITLTNNGTVNSLINKKVAAGITTCGRIDGDLTVGGSFADLSVLHEFQAVTGNVTFTITGNYQLLDDLPILQTISGNLEITGTSIQTISLPALTAVGASLRFQQNNALTTLNAPNLDAVVGNATISQNNQLDCHDVAAFLSGIASIGGTSSNTQNKNSVGATCP
jgi:hypothetical protein